MSTWNKHLKNSLHFVHYTQNVIIISLRNVIKLSLSEATLW